MKENTLQRFALPVTVGALFLSACGEKSDSPETVESTAAQEVTIPDAPDEAMRYIIDGIADGKGGVLWEAMPATYQSDVTEVVQLAGTKLDAEVYNKAFGLVARLGDVLEKQQEFVLNAAMMGEAQDEAQLAEARAAWPSVVNLVEVISTCSLASAEGLRRFDGKAFFNETVSAVLADVSTLSKLSPDEGEPTLADLKKATIKLLENSGSAARLEMSMPDEEVQTEAFVKVEGRWVPQEMADGWAVQIAEAKTQLEGIDPAQMAQQKPQILNMIALIDGVLTQVEAAETQEQFDAALKGAMMPLMGAAMMFQGMGGDGEAPAMPPMMPAPDAPDAP